VGKYEYLNVSVPSYGLRNENRLPTYHHLDLATLTPTKKQNRDWRMGLVFTMCTIEKRCFYQFRQNNDTGSNEAVKTSILVWFLR
jgi:hypothetical protein